MWSNNNMLAVRPGMYQDTLPSVSKIPPDSQMEETLGDIRKKKYWVVYIMMHKKRMPTLRTPFAGLSWIKIPCRGC